MTLPPRGRQTSLLLCVALEGRLEAWPLLASRQPRSRGGAAQINVDHQARQSHGNPATKPHNRPNPPGKPKGCGGRHLQCPESRISGGSTEPQVQDTRPIPYKEIPTSLTRSRPKSKNSTCSLWGVCVGGNFPTTEGCPTNPPTLKDRSTKS